MNHYPLPLSTGCPYDVVGLGGNAVDHLLLLPEFPKPDEKVKFLTLERQFGGRTTTPLVAMARLGLRTRYLGGVADDEEGMATLENLRSEGVETSAVRVRAGGLTQRAFILVEPDGRRTVVWGRSEGMPLEPEEVEPALVTSGRILFTDGQDPRTAAVAASLAGAAGRPVLADLEDIRPGLEDLLPRIDWLIASEAFPALATGRADLAESMPRLEERTGGGLIVVTRGAQGCAALMSGRVRSFPAYAVEVRDTTGAGDLFHAGFAAAALRGLPLPEALDFANATAAMGCRALGGRGSLPSSVEEIERFRRETEHR